MFANSGIIGTSWESFVFCFHNMGRFKIKKNKNQKTLETKKNDMISRFECIKRNKLAQETLENINKDLYYQLKQCPKNKLIAVLKIQ